VKKGENTLEAGIPNYEAKREGCDPDHIWEKKRKRTEDTLFVAVWIELKARSSEKKKRKGEKHAARSGAGANTMTEDEVESRRDN